MKIPLYWVDAFARTRFQGNPAAVVITSEELPTSLMQAVAAENHLPETAFVVYGEPHLGIRWFTPTVEVDLCGHATLAAAYALRESGLTRDEVLEFRSKSGMLEVRHAEGRWELDFPAHPPRRTEVSSEVIDALGASPRELHQAQDLMAVFDCEEAIGALSPRMDLIARLPARGVVVTAAGRACHFVSRFFAPQLGVPEDPVTGSTHCTLIPYWSTRLGVSRLLARQLSARGGEVWCEDRGPRVGIGGECVLYLKGEIEV